MDNLLVKAFFAALALVFGCVLGGWIISSIRSSLDTANQANQKEEVMSQSMMESEFTQYDATEITGSQVINIIKKYEQENVEKICIEVDNKRSVNDFVYTADLSDKASMKAKDAKNKGDLANYINPSSMFLGEVIRDEDTGAIIMVKFTKQ